MAFDRPSISVESDLKRILAQEQSRSAAYKGKLVASWIGLLALLAILFSGDTLGLGFINVDLGFIQEFGPFIVQGIGMTFIISATSIALAMILALLAALGRLSNNPILEAISTFYVSLIRGTPLYLQIIFFFLALPQMNIYLSGYWSGVIALSLNYGAYMSEIFRAGILSVDKGQHEAATALGMTGVQKMRFIVLPQALRFAIPPIGNEFIAMLKDSSLVSVTGVVHELLWRAQKVGRSNFRNLEALIIAAFFYWMLTLAFTAVQSRIESRYGQGDERVAAPH